MPKRGFINKDQRFDSHIFLSLDYGQNKTDEMCNTFDLSISSDGWKCDCTNVQGFVGEPLLCHEFFCGY